MGFTEPPEHPITILSMAKLCSGPRSPGVVMLHGRIGLEKPWRPAASVPDSRGIHYDNTHMDLSIYSAPPKHNTPSVDV